MASLRSRVVAALVPLDRGSRYVRDVEALRAHVAPGAKAASPAPPAWLRRRVRVARGEVAGVRCYRLTPRVAADAGAAADAAGARGVGGAAVAVGDRHVLYLHGGAYVGEVSSHHWRFLARLARASGATITVPVYTLAPEATASQVVAQVAGVQRVLEAPVVMGDSAGAGLALAVTQALRAQAQDGPQELVLLSPWVDATMTNPEITEVARRDPLLGVEALALAGLLYAGPDDDPAGPLASPINGDLTLDGRLTIFIGTRDVLLPDARRLRDSAEKAGTSVTYVEEPEMLHDWMLLPIPEAARTIDRLAGIAGVSPARP